MKASASRTRSGRSLRRALNEPFPKGKRLCVRVVHPEDPDPPVGPEIDDPFARLPKCYPVGFGSRPEIERVDVLVLFRRVLGIGDGPVGPVVEPLGVLRDPGVVRRALQRIVEGHFDPVVRRGLHQEVEVVEVAEVRVDGRMATLLRADRPRAARIPLFGRQRIIFPFAEGVPYRVDRRQVEDVEAHLRNPRHLARGTSQASEAAREQFVPGAYPGPFALDPDRHRSRCREVACPFSSEHVPVGPGLDYKLVCAQVTGDDGASPHVVTASRQGAGAHDLAASAQHCPGCEDVVAVPEDARRYGDSLPHQGFGRVTVGS